MPLFRSSSVLTTLTVCMALTGSVFGQAKPEDKKQEQVKLSKDEMTQLKR